MQTSFWHTFDIYKELTHVIMDVDKSQDLQLASWRPERTNNIICYLTVIKINVNKYFEELSKKKSIPT